MKIDLKYLDAQTFEDVCNNLLRREIGAVKSIDGSGGDKGIDGFKGEIESEVVVYQHKFYPGRLSKSSRKRSIKKSFDTAQKNHPEMEKWVLLIATDFTHGEQEWFEQEIAQSAPNIETDYWNKTEIEDRVIQHETLVHRYFPTSMMSLAERQNELLNYLDASVVEKTAILNNRLSKMKEEYPDLGIEYEISSKNGIESLSFNPDFDVSIHTQLKLDEDKAERIQQGKEVRFNKDEIHNIEFDPQILPDEEIDPDGFVVRPWHTDWEEDVQIEIPGGNFKKVITIVVKDVSEGVVTIGTEDPVFNISIAYDPQDENTEFDITPDFEDKPIHQISQLVDFVHQLKSNGRILIRRLEDRESVLSGELTPDDIAEHTDWLRDVISDLELIEAHTGISFSFVDEIDEEEDMNIIITKRLLTEGETPCPYTLTGEAMEGKRETLLDIYNADKPNAMKAKIEDFKMTILEQEVTIGDVEFLYPEPDLTNMDKIEQDIGESDPTEFKIKPSKDARIISSSES